MTLQLTRAMIESSSACTDEELRLFGKAHYTFINQIFGDLTVRSDIEALYPNACMTFGVQQAGDGLGAQSMHHVLLLRDEANAKIGTWCSVDGYDGRGRRSDFKHQDTTRDVNDTLCQSYTLLKYLYPRRRMPRNRIRLQRSMVAMYRRLLRDPAFLAKFETIDPEDWIDYRTDQLVHPSLRMTSGEIVAAIHGVLTDWERYGYKYYIGDGTCQG